MPEQAGTAGTTGTAGTHVNTVIGPPGTGKTSYLARQVGLAVRAGSVPTVVSLTKAAAAEAAGRGLPIPEGHVSTLHSQAYHALGGVKEIADAPKQLTRWNEANPHLALSGGV